MKNNNIKKKSKEKIKKSAKAIASLYIINFHNKLEHVWSLYKKKTGKPQKMTKEIISVLSLYIV